MGRIAPDIIPCWKAGGMMIDLDDFFKDVQKKKLVKEPVKATLRRIQSNYREALEAMLESESDGTTKESFMDSIEQHENRITTINALERAFDVFTQTFTEYKDFEITLVGVGEAEALSDLKGFHEDELESDKDYLEMLNNNKKPPSRGTTILRGVFGIINLMNCEDKGERKIIYDPRHALEITRLILFSENNNKRPVGRSLDQEWRRLMVRYGYPSKP
jgi:hypothetical protein